MQLKNDAKNINKKMNWNKLKIRIWNKQFTQGSRFYSFDESLHDPGNFLGHQHEDDTTKADVISKYKLRNALWLV